MSTEELRVQAAAIILDHFHSPDDGHRTWWIDLVGATNALLPVFAVVRAEGAREALDGLADDLNKLILADRARQVVTSDLTEKAAYRHRADGYEDARDTARARAARGESCCKHPKCPGGSLCCCQNDPVGGEG